MAISDSRSSPEEMGLTPGKEGETQRVLVGTNYCGFVVFVFSYKDQGCDITTKWDRYDEE